MQFGKIYETHGLPSPRLQDTTNVDGVRNDATAPARAAVLSGMQPAPSRQQIVVIYANAAGTSWPKPDGVAEAAQRAMLASPADNATLYRDGHRAVQRFFGIPDEAAERLLLAPSCTSALAVLLGDLVWNEGDVILTSSLEHHAVARPVQKLVWERGVQHVSIPYQPGTPVDMAFVERRLREGRVRLVAVTGASNVTGERLPIEELAHLVHAHGAKLLLDAAQTAGLIPIDVQQSGIDMLVFAGHKAMLGPFGIGGLWAAPTVPFTCPTASCEIGAATTGGSRAPFPGFCDLGSVNFPALSGLAAALAWLGDRTAAARRRPLELAQRLLDECREREHCQVLGGDGPRTATVSFVLAGVALADAQRHFRDHGVIVRAGTHCAPMALAALGQPEGCIRVSFGPHNEPGDVDAVLQAIDAR